MLGLSYLCVYVEASHSSPLKEHSQFYQDISNTRPLDNYQQPVPIECHCFFRYDEHYCFCSAK
jgi:hypothetical protein